MQGPTLSPQPEAQTHRESQREPELEKVKHSLTVAAVRAYILNLIEEGEEYQCCRPEPLDPDQFIYTCRCSDEYSIHPYFSITVNPIDMTRAVSLHSGNAIIEGVRNAEQGYSEHWEREFVGEDVDSLLVEVSNMMVAKGVSTEVRSLDRED